MFEDKLLIAREKRAKIVGEMIKISDVVTIKANVPGWEKNIPLATLLTKHFGKIVKSAGVKDIKRSDGADGLTLYGKVDLGLEFKEYAVALEQTHPLGRLVDIDVRLKGGKQSLSRGNLRKCFLCDNPAFVCGKNRTHAIGELVNFFNNTAKEYFHNLIAEFIKESMLDELNIEDKFGLVTPTSNGAHKDMNYSVMVDAIEVIKDRLADAFFVGLKADETENLIEKLIPIGIDCEEKMRLATNGANAYKGFIFAGGLLLASSGYALKMSLCFNNVFNVSADIYSYYTPPTDTFGFKSYQNGFGGIRKEAQSGFSTVNKAQKFIRKKPLWKILTFILSEIDDSVLLKRADGVDNYARFKKLIVESTKQNRKDVTQKCIVNNVSIGGSADLLICALLMDRIKHNFIF